MGYQKYRVLGIVEMLVLLSWSYRANLVEAVVDCTTVSQLLSTCSVFILRGSPDPIPGSPCCAAVSGLNHLGDSVDSRRALCRCLMGMISASYPSPTALATLPGFCGVSLGFVIDPNTDCN
ncbi:hypothetical protein Ancab_009617 [Ancistrocladus abbreviatus]